MKYIATMIIAIALTAPMSMPVNAGWASFSEKFSDANIWKAVSDKNCWERALSFQKAKRTTCKK